MGPVGLDWIGLGVGLIKGEETKKKPTCLLLCIRFFPRLQICLVWIPYSYYCFLVGWLVGFFSLSCVGSSFWLIVLIGIKNGYLS